MIEIPISSEIANLINFVACELLIMSYTMYVTSYIAGALNYVQLDKGRSLTLRVFNSPFGIGGGLVMSSSRGRWVLIMLRFTILVAITTSNFGLEGRTRVLSESRLGVVRIPGRIDPLNTTTLFAATERQMRCAQTSNDTSTIYGAVIDDKCYPSLSTNLRVKSISISYTHFNASAVGCAVVPNKHLYFTVFRCRGVDLNCLGIFNESTTTVEKGRCESVIYEKDYSWLCPVDSARPGVIDEPVRCLRVEARRADIERWTEVFRYSTQNLQRAIFGAAYGVEERKMVTVPVGQRNVTIVTLFWLVPAVCEVIVIWIATVWAITLLRQGAKNVGNDEDGLTRLLKNKLDISKTRLSDYLDDIEVPSSPLWRTSRVHEEW